MTRNFYTRLCCAKIHETEKWQKVAYPSELFSASTIGFLTEQVNEELDSIAACYASVQ